MILTKVEKVLEAACALLNNSFTFLLLPASRSIRFSRREPVWSLTCLLKTSFLSRERLYVFTLANNACIPFANKSDNGLREKYTFPCLGPFGIVDQDG